MSFENGKLQCDMVDGCFAPVTHIDGKGYVYCSEHGQIRKQYCRCRKLKAVELKSLRLNQPLKRY